MATTDTKESVLPPTTAHVPHGSAVPPSPPHSSGRETLPKPSIDTYDNSTPPFSPASDTPVLQKEQEEFEGTVDVNNDLPSEKDLKKVEDLLILDAQGKSRPFRELYDASGVAPRQLIIFIRHFFCGVSYAICMLSAAPRTDFAELSGIPPHPLLIYDTRRFTCSPHTNLHNSHRLRSSRADTHVH